MVAFLLHRVHKQAPNTTTQSMRYGRYIAAAGTAIALFSCAVVPSHKAINDDGSDVVGTQDPYYNVYPRLL